MTARVQVLAVSIISLIGSVLHLIGVSLVQNTIDKNRTNFNPLGVHWYITILFFFVNSIIILANVKNLIEKYRIALSVLLGTLISYIPDLITNALLIADKEGKFNERTSIETQRLAHGSAIGAAGLIIIVCCSFVLLLFIGCDQGAPFNPDVIDVKIPHVQVPKLPALPTITIPTSLKRKDKSADEPSAGWFSPKKESDSSAGWFAPKKEEAKPGWFRGSASKTEAAPVAAAKKETKKEPKKTEESSSGWFAGPKEQVKPKGWFSSTSDEKVKDKKEKNTSNATSDTPKTGWFSSSPASSSKV